MPAARKIAAHTGDTAATVAEATMLACCMKNCELSKSVIKAKLTSTWAAVKKHKTDLRMDVRSLIHPVVASAAAERSYG